MLSLDTYNSIKDYFDTNADIQVGIRIFLAIKGNNHPFAKLLFLAGAKQAINQELSLISGIIIPEEQIPKPIVKVKLRDDFPFLNQPDCPLELKILAANKITAYHNYVHAHAQLFGCTNNQQQFEVVKKVVENYIENRLIYQEFDYYKKHKALLGLHPIFKIYKKNIAMRKLSPIALVKKQSNLNKAIARLKKDIALSSIAHLQVAREQSLKIKLAELAEVNRLLKEYE